MLLKSVICYLLYQENNYALAIAKHGNQHITLSWGKVFKYTNVAYILTKLININLWKLHKCAAFFWIQERKQVCFPNHSEFLSENICRVFFFFSWNSEYLYLLHNIFYKEKTFILRRLEEGWAIKPLRWERKKRSRQVNWFLSVRKEKWQKKNPLVIVRIIQLYDLCGFHIHVCYF